MSDFGVALLSVVVLSGIIIIFVVVERHKQRKDTDQYNLVHAAHELNTSIPKETINNFYTVPSTFSFSFSQVELALLTICLKYIRKIIQDSQEQKLSTLISKISSQYKNDPDFPYDSLIDLNSEETSAM